MALWFRKLANRLELKSIGPKEIFTIFEGAFFETYFPVKHCPEGPPSKKWGSADLSRDRILKGLGKCKLVECSVRNDDGFEFITTVPTEMFEKREGFGDIENTIANLRKRGILPNESIVEESVEQTTSTRKWRGK